MRKGSSFGLYVSHSPSPTVSLSDPRKPPVPVSREDFSNLCRLQKRTEGSAGSHALGSHGSSTHSPSPKGELGKIRLNTRLYIRPISPCAAIGFLCFLFSPGSKLEAGKREVGLRSDSSLHLSYTGLAEGYISSRLPWFYFPDVFVLQGHTNRNRSFPVRPWLHLSLVTSPLPMTATPSCMVHGCEFYFSVFIIIFSWAHSWEGEPLFEAIQMGLTWLKSHTRTILGPLGGLPRVWLVRGMGGLSHAFPFTLHSPWCAVNKWKEVSLAQSLCNMSLWVGRFRILPSFSVSLTELRRYLIGAQFCHNDQIIKIY